MTGGPSVPWPRMFVFFRLMISPKSLQAWEKWSISSCSSLWVCVMTVASSANNMSLMRASQTFVLAFRQARLKTSDYRLIWSAGRFPLVLCQMCASGGECRRSQRELGQVHSLVWLLGISKGSERLPLNCTVPFMLEWKDSIKPCSLGGQPILRRALKRPSLLRRSKALVKLMKAMYRGICCSLHFSWSW